MLCFTRSSSIIHYLPSIYPNPGSFKSHEKEDTYVKELVYDDPTLVQLCQIVSVQSQTTIQETIRDFTQSNRKVLVLLANMQVCILVVVINDSLLIVGVVYRRLLQKWSTIYE